MKHKHIKGVAHPVYPIGLGCMGMSDFYGESDDAASFKVLDKAVELGVNFLDTADTYGLGHNESLIGSWLKTKPKQTQEKMVIATKFGIVRKKGEPGRRIDNSPGYIREAVEASLKRLGVQSLDLYYCHRRDASVEIEVVMETLSELVTEGKIKAVGLSEVNAETLRRAHAVHPVSALQSEYSPWHRTPEQEMIPLCKELGVQFVAYSPLGRAFLTGTLDTTQLSEHDVRRKLPRFQGEAKISNETLVASLTELGQEWGYSNAQLSLAWMLNKYDHVIPIPGTRRERYLIENTKASQISLTPSQIEAIDACFPVTEVKGDRYPEGYRIGIERE